eukprot:jgi/Mesvir1/24285/Mv10982-RA.2
MICHAAHARHSRWLLAAVFALTAGLGWQTEFCAAGNVALKRNAGPPEEFFRPPSTDRMRNLGGFHVRSSSVSKTLAENGEVTTVRPGGQVKSLVLLNLGHGTAASRDILESLELAGISGSGNYQKASSLEGATVRVISDPVRSTASLLFSNAKLTKTAHNSMAYDGDGAQMQAVSIRFNGSFFEQPKTSTRQDAINAAGGAPFVIATGYADLTLEVGFRQSDMFVGMPIDFDICATSGDLKESLKLVKVSVAAVHLSSDGKVFPAIPVSQLPAATEDTKVDATGTPAGACCVSFSHVADSPGHWEFRVDASGEGSSIGDFERTAHVTANVGDMPLGHILAAKMVTTMENGVEYAAITISGAARAPQSWRVAAYGELLGTDEQGTMGPVAYARHIAEIEPAVGNASTWETTLLLHTDWMAREAKFRAPYALQNVSFRSVNHGYLRLNAMEEGSILPVMMADSLTKSKLARVGDPSMPITDEMRYGRNPLLTDANKGRKLLGASGQKVLLVHGYCSSDVWGPSMYQFSNAVKYYEPKQNLPHDEFARRIADFAEYYDMFTIVAHSQGGAAALHLYDNYWSGLDNASPASRRIQSVGTPYLGTPLAEPGYGMSIGTYFQEACGANDDLGRQGAQAWLQTIAYSSRKEVYYYTTSDDSSDDYYISYCSWKTDAFLNDPNDGIVEMVRGQLDGARNMGHKVGWCHTEGMSDPRQTDDGQRNAQMNRYAQAPPAAPPPRSPPPPRWSRPPSSTPSGPGPSYSAAGAAGPTAEDGPSIAGIAISVVVVVASIIAVAVIVLYLKRRRPVADNSNPAVASTEPTAAVVATGTTLASHEVVISSPRKASFDDPIYLP